MSNPTTHDGHVLGDDGLHRDRPNTISTWTGRIDPLNPDPSEVRIHDVAHALARLCRYNGHTGGFYSVARHSFIVSCYLEDTGHPELALQGLLHDGAEAYLSDVPRPVKRNPEMEVFRKFDAQMDEAVMAAFGLPFPIPAEVMAADHWVLMELELPSPHGLRYTWDTTPALDEAVFLYRYAELTGDWTVISPAQIALIESDPMAEGTSAPLVIGVAGYARAGKDTVGRALIEHHDVQRIAFADKLKELLSEIDPVLETRAVCADLPPGNEHAPTDPRCMSAPLSTWRAWGASEDWLKDNTDYRGYLQDLGAGVRTILGEDTWVRAALMDLEPGQKYVITDVRYPNEADAIRAMGGSIWRVRRDGTGPANDHASETAMDDYRYDVTLHNDGTVDDLARGTSKALAYVLASKMGA